MILTVDIGNTNIVFGIFQKENLIADYRIYTNLDRTSDEYSFILNQILFQNNIIPQKFSGAIISSVVPRVSQKIKTACRLSLNISPILINTKTNSGVTINIDNPNELGSDFIAASAAIIIKYPLPSIVIDLGTATKIFAIDENKAFLGTSITAGVSTSLDALAKHAAQLPNISIKERPPIIGKNTIDSISSGIVYSTAGAIDALIDLYKEQIGKISSIVATGGISQDIIGHCKNNIILDKNLILYGLHHIYKREKNIITD